MAGLVVVLGYLCALGPLLQGPGVGRAFLPDAAGSRLWQLDVTTAGWDRLTGGAVLAAWTLAALAVGASTWCRRDVGG